MHSRGLSRLAGAPLSASRQSRHLACVGTSHSRRQNGTCVRAFEKAGKPPSMQPSATELEALEQMSTVVPDLLLREEISLLGAPKAATVSPTVLGGILGIPTGFRMYENAIEKAISYDKDPKRQLDKALANVGTLFADEVEGRVATELDPRLARDEDGMVAQAQHLMSLYEEMEVPKEKLILQIPATWEGIQAAKKLEAEGINTLLSLVYSFVQAVAAAQAGVSVVQVNMGRLNDWYNAHPGVIRDPKGPREDSGCSSTVNQGCELVKRMYNYCKLYHPKTLVMASGARTKGDALAVAGCDFIILGPRVLKALDASPTAQGYNDGLVGQSGDTGVECVLSQPSALQQKSEESLGSITQKEFESSLGIAAKSLLDQGIDGLIGDLERVMPVFSGIAVGTE